MNMDHENPVPISVLHVFLFLFINIVLEVNFCCTGKWWVRGLSQLLTTTLEDYTGEKRQELARNRGLNNREKMFRTSFSQFSVWWLIRGQWSKPQSNWKRPRRCSGRPWSSTLAQLAAALPPRESVAAVVQPPLRSGGTAACTACRGCLSPHAGLKRSMEGRRKERR